MNIQVLLNRHAYINLETRKKNGTTVQTPVWFVTSGEDIFVTTQKGSGKVKRISNFPDVRFAPCDARGNLKGDWYEGTAIILKDNQSSVEINRLFNKKYGLIKKIFDLFGSNPSNQRLFIQIKPKITP